MWTEEGRRLLSLAALLGEVRRRGVNVCVRVRVPRAGNSQHGDPGIHFPLGPSPGRNNLGCLGEKLGFPPVKAQPNPREEGSCRRPRAWAPRLRRD